MWVYHIHCNFYVYIYTSICVCGYTYTCATPRANNPFSNVPVTAAGQSLTSIFNKTNVMQQAKCTPVSHTCTHLDGSRAGSFPRPPRCPRGVQALTCAGDHPERPAEQGQRRQAARAPAPHPPCAGSTPVTGARASLQSCLSRREKKNKYGEK